MHRNIRRAKKVVVGERFKIGDKVLIQNPECKEKKGGVMQPRNVIGVVSDILRGGMYQPSLGEGDDVYQQDIFVGQMVMFNEGHADEEEIDNHKQIKLRKEIIEEISKFEEDTRDTIFGSSQRYRNRSYKDIGRSMEDYFGTLDLGFQAKYLVRMVIKRKKKILRQDINWNGKNWKEKTSPILCMVQ